MIYRLTDQEKKNVSSKLQDDIIKGIYDSFPSLKNRLNYISNKLIEKCYIINSEDLSNSEYDELRNQGYLDNF